MDVLKTTKTKKILTVFLFLAIITIILVLFFSLNKSRTAATAAQNNLTATGTVEARKVSASFKIPGRIENMLVAEGDQIQEGQELARLDNRELSAKLSQADGALEAALAQARLAENSILLTSRQIETAIEQAQARVSQAEVGLETAQDLHEKMKELYENAAVAEKTYTDAKNNYSLAQSVLREAQAALDQAQAARLKIDLAQAEYEAASGQSDQAGGAVHEAQAYLDNTCLQAPISGFITQKYLEQGEMANAGTPVFEISDLLHTYVKVFISEEKIGRVHLGQDVEITVASYPDQVYHGRVAWINDAGEFAVHKAVNEQYDHDIRSVEVKIDVPNADLSLKTGMTARVNIIEG